MRLINDDLPEYFDVICNVLEFKSLAKINEFGEIENSSPLSINKEYFVYNVESHYEFYH